MSNIILILVVISILGMIVGTIINFSIKKKEALAVKPKDDRIYKVFEIEYEGKIYYVIKNFWYTDISDNYSWDLVGDYDYYKNLTKEQVIRKCDELNDNYVKKLHSKKMTNVLDSVTGNMVN